RAGVEGDRTVSREDVGVAAAEQAGVDIGAAIASAHGADGLGLGGAGQREKGGHGGRREQLVSHFLDPLWVETLSGSYACHAAVTMAGAFGFHRSAKCVTGQSHQGGGLLKTGFEVLWPRPGLEEFRQKPPRLDGEGRRLEQFSTARRSTNAVPARVVVEKVVW